MIESLPVVIVFLWEAIQFHGSQGNNVVSRPSTESEYKALADGLLNVCGYVFFYMSFACQNLQYRQSCGAITLGQYIYLQIRSFMHVLSMSRSISILLENWLPTNYYKYSTLAPKIKLRIS